MANVAVAAESKPTSGSVPCVALHVNVKLEVKVFLTLATDVDTGVYVLLPTDADAVAIQTPTSTWMTVLRQMLAAVRAIRISETDAHAAVAVAAAVCH